MKFLSCEPLLEDIADIDLTGIDWAIVGGESGCVARAFDLQWARNLKARCAEFSVSFFFKQVGSRPEFDGSPFKIVQKQPNGKKDLHGKFTENFPTDLQVQEWPNPERRSDLDSLNEGIDGDMMLPEPVFSSAPTSKEPPLHIDELDRVMRWLSKWSRVEDSPLGYMAEAARSAIAGMNAYASINTHALPLHQNEGGLMISNESVQRHSVDRSTIEQCEVGKSFIGSMVKESKNKPAPKAIPKTSGEIMSNGDFGAT